MKETILDTIRNNLIGEDQDLAKKTKTLLKQDPVLAQKVSDAPEMKKVLEAHDRMPLLKTMKHKEHLSKMPDYLFQEVAKYL